VQRKGFMKLMRKLLCVLERKMLSSLRRKLHVLRSVLRSKLLHVLRRLLIALLLVLQTRSTSKKRGQPTKQTLRRLLKTLLLEKRITSNTRTNATRSVLQAKCVKPRSPSHVRT
jgi:hypothetical protein